jgi:hypothetical protein
MDEQDGEDEPMKETSPEGLSAKLDAANARITELENK